MTTHMIFRFILALALAGVSGYLATHSLDGWGWFLFAALVVVG